jgi:5,10-methylenetetrahydromethanopterin reductase
LSDKTGRAAVEATVAKVERADRLGFHSVWLTEDPDGWDAFAVLGALALRTERILLGPGVTNPILRHPNLIAASVATIDRLSNGRAFLGIGRGQPEWYRALGMDASRPLARLEQAIGLLRQWWEPPHVASSGEPFAVHGWERTFAPASRPPVYIAAAGDKALALAGRVADGVRFNELASLDYLRRAVEVVRAAAVEAGRDPAALAFFVHPSITVTDDPATAFDRKKTTIAMIHALPGMERQLETPGIDVAAIMAEVRRVMRTEEVLARGGGFAEMRRAGDLAAAKRAIPDELVARVAAVGTEAQVGERLGALRRIGMTHVFIDPGRSWSDDGELRRFLEAIAPETD